MTISTRNFDRAALRVVRYKDETILPLISCLIITLIVNNQYSRWFNVQEKLYDREHIEIKKTVLFLNIMSLYLHA